MLSCGILSSWCKLLSFSRYISPLRLKKQTTDCVPLRIVTYVSCFWKRGSLRSKCLFLVGWWLLFYECTHFTLCTKRVSNMVLCLLACSKSLESQRWSWKHILLSLIRGATITGISQNSLVFYFILKLYKCLQCLWLLSSSH